MAIAIRAAMKRVRRAGVFLEIINAVTNGVTISQGVMRKVPERSEANSAAVTSEVEE